MYPWLWLWAPQFRFPFSGSVAQDYEPNTEWFFARHNSNAGDGKVEAAGLSRLLRTADKLAYLPKLCLPRINRARSRQSRVQLCSKDSLGHPQPN